MYALYFNLAVNKSAKSPMRLPNLTFSNWVRWTERANLDSINEPGVYILAQFKRPPVGIANPQTRQIIYIGETCNNSLRGRWREFNRAAFQGKFGHSGGATYRAQFGDDGRTLYVAALPAGRVENKLQTLFIRYVERKLILDYALKWGSAPICNRK